MANNLPTQVPTPDTTPSPTGLSYFVDDPYGTPSDNAATNANIVTKAHGLSDGFQQVASGIMTAKNAADTKTDLSLVKGDVGLGNVDNTSDATKNAASVTLTNKTLTTPTIADFTNATHNHTNNAGGGTLTHSAVTDFDTQVRTSTLNQMTAPTADLSINSHKLTSVTDPTSAQDAATKAYVDAIAQGLSVKQSVKLATAAALPTNTYLSGVITITATGTLTVDGTVTALNDRILVKDESAQLENGVYTVTTAGAVGVAAVLTRSADMDTSTEFPGAFVFAEAGTVNAAAGFVCTNSSPPTVGTTAITFTQFSGAGEITAGNGLGKSANTLSIDTSITVDKTTAQVLTNKDLTSGTNTFPTLNQNTTGSAAKWTTARNLAGNSVDGSADVAFANKFVVQGTTDAGLSAAQFLGSLGTGIVKNSTTTGVLSIAVGGDFPTLNQNTTGSAATLTTPRTIGGVSFDGSANITVATATGGFTVSGGDLALGANNLTMTGSLGATGARLTKGWFTDLQVTNAISGSVTGNAATVTTNANLTGPITSSGNATSIASQTGTGTKFVVDTSPTIVTPTIASFANANHDHSNSAGGGTISHANLTSLTTGDPHTQYAILAGRSGGQALIGGTASGDGLTIESTSNGTKGSVSTVSGSQFIVGGTTTPLGNASTKFGVNHNYTYSAGETVIANDMRSLPTFNTTGAGKFTGTDLTSIVTATAALNSNTAVSFQSGANNSATTTLLVGVNAFATATGGVGTVTTASSAQIGLGALAGTITQQYGINFTNQGFSGTVTNGTAINVTNVIGGTTLKVGIDIAAITGGTTNIGVRNASSLLQQGAFVGTPTTVSVTTNAGTVPVTAFVANFTNSSAANMTVTMAVTGASDGQISIVRIYDASAVSKTITWVNTEVGEATAPAASNGSTTLPKTVTFMFNGATSLWRCLIV